MEWIQYIASQYSRAGEGWVCELTVVYVWEGVSPSEAYAVATLEVSLLGELLSRPVFSEARFSVSVSESGIAAIVYCML